MAETQYITSAIDGFKAITGLLSDGHILTFVQAKSISDFYSRHKDTNALIIEAEALAHENPDGLREDAGRLDGALTEFLSIAASDNTPDFKDVCDTYIGPFEQAYEQSKRSAHEAWMEYQSLSRRLDYLPLDSDEYVLLDKECDTTKAEYDKLHAEVERNYAILRENQNLVAPVYYFEMSHLVILAERIKSICESIGSDIKRLHEEGLI